MNTLIAEAGLIHGSGFEITGDAVCMSTGTLRNAEMAAQLLHDRAVSKVVCSGRGPVEGIDYGTSEAQLLADYLIRTGFGHQLIEIEDGSTSAMGNWANSTPIFRRLGVESVVGVTANVNIRRMRCIGKFVAERSDFSLVGYKPSQKNAQTKDRLRETLNYGFTVRFLNKHMDTPVDHLEEAYEAYKAHSGLATLKRYINRGSAPSNVS